MGASKEEKGRSHERIVKIAAARVRALGVNGMGVHDLMKAAGMTHGGFYRHFESRDDLLAETIQGALREGGERMRSALEEKGEGRLAAVIDGYLSPAHRDDVATSCAVSALANDAARCRPDVRRRFTEQVEDYLGLIARHLPTGTSRRSRRSRSIHAFSAMVGALVLARAVVDPALSAELLEEAAAGVKQGVKG